MLPQRNENAPAFTALPGQSKGLSSATRDPCRHLSRATIRWWQQPAAARWFEDVDGNLFLILAAELRVFDGLAIQQ